MKISKIRNGLKKIIKGEVIWEKDILNYYSVDASSYQILPKIVVIPKNESDVISLVKFAKKEKMSITVRGAGTGLVGSALNNGIIADMKNFDSIKIGKHIANVGSGVLKGALDKKLRSKNKFFPPNPSIGSFCSIGGMLGNNSSGSRSLKYGSIIDNVKEITFVNGNGEKITLPKNTKIGKKITSFSKMMDKKKIPNTTKNSSGYRLDAAVSIANSHKAILGSEGTLGIILSAKLKIQEIPKKRVLSIIEYTSLTESAKNCKTILNTSPSAIEFVDLPTLRQIPQRFNKKTKCILFVEYDSNINNKIKELETIKSGNITYQLSRESKIQKWWKYRDSALYFSLRTIKKEKRLPHVIEDATVPIEKLGELFETVVEINRKFSTKVIMYGHAGNANIHVRLIADRKKIKKIKRIADFYFNRVISMEGTITGEHGDGLARSEYVKKQYGVKNYAVFRQLKKFFDPKGILNPEKIITRKRLILKNLEVFEKN
ncbi:FAD-binding oxidoreductase [Nitrosopumilus sp. K4]|uniref:FAD-binding oxidoreductase n=1 Tax=Nitrosopumilus sp. K4 TaxID=2795383 RepID=UPI001BA6BE9C|nr:FAD-binding oxidoreductase [Nitrosopumilus sp. K4]QUC65307.1 FAD-binding oxidoreductase [Nitrosopumilus sp. K4]